MQRLKKCWSVVSAKIFDVLSPAPHSMLAIHFSSTHRPFPRWEIDFSCAPAPHTMLSTRSMRVMMIYKNILDAEHFYIRSLIDDKEEKVVHLLWSVKRKYADMRCDWWHEFHASPNCRFIEWKSSFSQHCMGSGGSRDRTTPKRSHENDHRYDEKMISLHLK